MSSSVPDRYARHVNPTFVKLLGLLGYGRVMTRAEGTRLWDQQDRSYLDFLAGYGSINLGHNHPRLIAALADALGGQRVHLCHTGPTVHETDAAEALAAAAGPPLEVVLAATSGAEAVEAAVKLARAATGRRDVLYCTGGFHGLSLGTLSLMGAPRLRAPFEPLLPGCVAIRFGDRAALAAALAGRRFAAFVVEPIQAEAGVIVPPPGYLAEAARLCRAAGTLLVLDEIQTGLGRTGQLFAFHGEGVVPDVLVVAKALSGGVVPAAAAVTTAAIHRRAYGRLDRFDLHGSTFAGNALASAATIATLRIIADQDLAGRAADLGHRLLGRLRDRLADHPLVADVRGRGLLVGVELARPTTAALDTVRAALTRLSPGLAQVVPAPFIGQWLSVRLLEAGFVCQPASHAWDVLKLEPPLTIEAADVDRMVDTLAGILEEYRSLPALVKDVVARLVERGARGWAW